MAKKGQLANEDYISLYQEDCKYKAPVVPDNQKRRGRKRIKDDEYFKLAIKRIMDQRMRLKNSDALKLSMTEKKNLRNKISAQNARLRKKEESIFLNTVVMEKDRKMKVLLDGLSSILTEQQKVQLFPIAREWVEKDIIRLGAPEYVDFGEIKDIKSSDWECLKREMIENFETTEEQLKRFEQNDEKGDQMYE